MSILYFRSGHLTPISTYLREAEIQRRELRGVGVRGAHQLRLPPTASHPLFRWPCLQEQTKGSLAQEFLLRSLSDVRLPVRRAVGYVAQGVGADPPACGFPPAVSQLTGRGQDLFLILWPWPDSSLALLEDPQLPSGSTHHHSWPLVK